MRYGPVHLGGERVGSQIAEARLNLGLELDGQEAPQRRKHGVQLGPEQRAELGARLRPHGDLGLAVLDPEPAAEDLGERPVEQLAAVGRAVPLQPGRPISRHVPELDEQPCLPDSRLADDQRDLPATGLELAQQGPKAFDLAVAPDEGSREGGGFSTASTSRQAATASSRPLTGTLPSGSSRNRFVRYRPVASPMTIVPASAAFCRRAATFVASPSATG